MKQTTEERFDGTEKTIKRHFFANIFIELFVTTANIGTHTQISP